MTLEEIINSSQEATIEELKEVFKKMLGEVNYSSIICLRQTFNGFYRARKHLYYNGDLFCDNHEIFISEKEFWNPPPERIKWNQRCNRAGESIFYASTKFETAIKEIRPEVGKFITVCSFKPHLNDDKKPSFRIKPIAIRHLKKIKGITSCLEKFDPNNLGKLDNILDKLITKKINPSEDYLYKITIAIKELMMIPMKDNDVDLTINGMLYPSVIDDLQGANLILKPISSLHFGIKSIQTFYVEKILEPGKFKMRIVRSGEIPFYKRYPDIKYDIEWKDIIDGEYCEA